MSETLQELTDWKIKFRLLPGCTHPNATMEISGAGPRAIGNVIKPETARLHDRCPITETPRQCQLRGGPPPPAPGKVRRKLLTTQKGEQTQRRRRRMGA